MIHHSNHSQIAACTTPPFSLQNRSSFLSFLSRPVHLPAFQHVFPLVVFKLSSALLKCALISDCAVLCPGMVCQYLAYSNQQICLARQAPSSFDQLPPAAANLSATYCKSNITQFRRLPMDYTAAGTVGGISGRHCTRIHLSQASATNLPHQLATPSFGLLLVPYKPVCYVAPQFGWQCQENLSCRAR